MTKVSVRGSGSGRWLLATTVVAALLAGCGVGEPEGETDELGRLQAAVGDFNPLPDGFQWRMEDRFPRDTDNDGVREERFDAPYVRPEQYGGYKVNFDGCVPNGGSAYRYSWRFGFWSTEGSCKYSLSLPRLGQYEVSLTVERDGASRTYKQVIHLKDFLIVSIGDSYGSGEGAPDVAANWDAGRGPRWANQRCHRSFNSPSAKAALALEEADPHSTVTYLSFACSGATISRETWEADPLPLHGFAGPGDGPHNGSGILSRYVGIERGSPEYLEPQVAQMMAVVGNRPIDTLVVSAGGNDVGFGDILRWCTLYMECTWGNDGRGLRQRVDPLKAALPNRYAALSEAIERVTVRSVQLMEYPDLTRNRQGGFCSKILQDTNWYTFGETTGTELFELDRYVYQPLLQTMQSAAAAHQWTYVTGIADDFAGRGRSPIGRGYCTAWYERWINTAWDAAARQGPKGSEKNTKGTAHPNAQGYEAMSLRLLDSIRAVTPELAPDGTILRDPISGGIYVIHGGAKFWVPSMEWFNRLGLDEGAVRNVSARDLARFPAYAPRDGTLLRDPTDGRVYVVSGGAKLYISSPQQFDALGYDWARVRDVPSPAIGAMANVPRDGSLVHDRVSGKVYVTHGGAKLYISSPLQFDLLNYQRADVRTVPETALAAIPDVPRDGTLYRTETNNGVTAVFQGARFSVPSEDYLTRVGWDTSSILRIPSTAVENLPQLPSGHVDIGGTNGVVAGWAYDADVPGQPIYVHIYVDGPAGVGTYVGGALTTVDRPDVNAAFPSVGLTGPHGFHFPLPTWLRDGREHRLYVYALDDDGRWNPWLDAMPFAFTWN